MISIPALITLLWIHTIADFVLQTDEMAINKSKSNYWLWLHVTVYSLCLWPMAFWIGLWGAWFIILNFVAHFATDYVTSRMTTKLWKQERRHAFFVVIGIDQALHITALVVTYYWISGL